jgi:hypothetical protein
LNVLRSRTHFQLYRGRQFSYSCFEPQNSFSAITSASGPVFIFCATRLVFGDTEGVRSYFHVLRARTRFRRYRWRRVPYSCFARRDTFIVVPRAPGSVFMFCALGLVFNGTEGVRSRFHVLRCRDRFQRCRVCRVPF